MKIRSIFLLLSSITFTTFVHSAPANNGEVKQIAENVFAFKDNPQGFVINSMFVVTCEGVIAIEPFDTVHSRKLVAAIRKVTNKPIKYLLISHNHWDHSRGGKVFSDEGATVIAHQEAADWMEEHPTEDLYLPDRTWRGRKQTLCLGGARVELNYYGVNHGQGMTVFVYKPPNGTPQDNVAYIADLVAPNRVFFGSVPDYNMQEAIRTYREIVKLPFQKVVFSHSPFPDDQPDGTMQEVRLALNYATDLDAAVRQAFAEGKNLVADPGQLDLPKYKNLGFYEIDFVRNVQKFALEVFIGPFPWRSVKRYLEPSKTAFPRRRNNQW